MTCHSDPALREKNLLLVAAMPLRVLRDLCGKSFSPPRTRRARRTDPRRDSYSKDKKLRSYIAKAFYPLRGCRPTRPGAVLGVWRRCWGERNPREAVIREWATSHGRRRVACLGTIDAIAFPDHARRTIASVWSRWRLNSLSVRLPGSPRLAGKPKMQTPPSSSF
jgi:hypothetical protein